MRRSPMPPRRTSLPRSSSPLRRTPLAARPAEPTRRSKATKPDVPASVRRAVRERSGGICEACGTDRAEHVHHRKLRSQGGRHEPANLLHVSHACHAEIHATPKRAYGLGLLVRRADDPASVPVRMFGVGPGELYGGAA